MDHLHEIVANTPGHTRPGNQLDVESFISARNQEIQALLSEISKFFKIENYLQVLSILYTLVHYSTIF